MMTLPGLGLFYGGLARSKNFLSVLMQCGLVAAVASVFWVVIGYSWALGPDTNWFLGGSTHWTWGGGWLSSQFGAFDFAGGIVVHTTVGVSPLVIAIMRLSAETYSTPFASANSGC